MAESKISQEFNGHKEATLSKMKDKWQSQAEKLLNPYGNVDVNQMLGDPQKENREFSDHGFDKFTLFYRKPGKFWNEVGLLVHKGMNTSASVKVHVFFMGGGFVSITLNPISGKI